MYLREAQRPSDCRRKDRKKKILFWCISIGETWLAGQTETADSTTASICLVIRPLLLCMHNTGQCNLMKPLRSHKMSVSTAEYYQENIHY